MGKRQAYTKIMETERAVSSLVEEYLEMKKAEGVTGFTLDIQKGILRRFFENVPDCNQDEKQWKREIQLHLADKKSAYFNKQLDALRQFFEYCKGEGIIEINPCEGISYKKATSRIVDHSEDSIRKLLQAPDKTTFTGLRDYTYLILTLDTGIRPYEALQLLVNDIHLQEKYIHVREEVAKTRQARFLPMSPPLVQAIRRIIQVRHPSWDKNGIVLCNHFGERMDTHSLQERFRIYSDKIGVKITAYMLRHCFALNFIRNGGDPFSLQRIMGHTRLDQTKEYVNLASADIANNHAKATPLNVFCNKVNSVGKLKNNKKI